MAAVQFYPYYMHYYTNKWQAAIYPPLPKKQRVPFLKGWIPRGVPPLYLHCFDALRVQFTAP